MDKTDKTSFFTPKDVEISEKIAVATEQPEPVAEEPEELLSIPGGTDADQNIMQRLQHVHKDL